VPKLLWDCLEDRLEILEPFSRSGRQEIISELSEITSEMFDLTYAKLKNSKVKPTAQDLA